MKCHIEISEICIIFFDFHIENVNKSFYNYDKRNKEVMV